MREGNNKSRIIFVALALGTVLAALGVRLAAFHVHPPEGMRESLLKRRVVEKIFVVRRGTIQDRNADDNLLALDLDVKDVCADPSFISEQGNLKQVAASLAPALGLDDAIVTARIDRPTRRFAYVERFVDADRVKAIEALKLPGVFFQDASIRHYPHDDFMCHVLGFSNLAGYGGAGIELSLDRFLRGSPGLAITEVDGLRRDRYLRRTLQVPPKDGANVILTLDQNLQYMVEKVIEQTMEEHHARAVCAIVQDVHTGEILAMANRPTYNPNDYRSADPEAVMNRCIAAVYEPGSTLKVIAISAALEEGMVTTATVVDCENGAWMHHGRLLRDHHPYGRLSVEDILKKSSNIGTAKVAVSLGDRRFERYLRAYGLGDRLKIDLPGEETGILHPAANWSAISSSRIAIGQGVAVTPLQMIGLYSAIANGGSLMRPVVVKKIVTDEGVELLVPGQQVLSRPISAKTAETMRRMLARVTDEGGTGTRARVAGIDIAGKTGTAQKAERGGYSNTKYMASFVGFLPAEAPEIAIIVVVDEPQPIHTGGYVAAPAFSKIAEQAVRYLHIVPDQFNVASR